MHLTGIIHMGISRFPKLLLIAFIACYAITITACRSKHKKTSVSTPFAEKKFSEDDFVDALEAVYEPHIVDDTVWAKEKLHSVNDIMHYTYRAYEYLPLWLNEDGSTKAAQQLLAELNELEKDGLKPERYKASMLKQKLAEFDKAKEPDANSLVALDTLMTRAYLNAAHDLMFGVLLPKQADSLWFHSNDSAWAPERLLLERLYAEGEYPTLDSFRSKLPTYAALRKAKEQYIKLNSNNALMAAKAAVATAKTDSLIDVIVKAELPWANAEAADTLTKAQAQLRQYQEYYGLKTTGRMDSATTAYLAMPPIDASVRVDANLERLRWMPQHIEDLHIMVNIPLMELFLRKDGQDMMHMRVVVGKMARQTPSLNANMVNVVINPPWGVPPTIMKKEVMPGIERGGAAYLRKKGLEVFDFKGNKVNPATINASNYKRYVFKQPPGDDNALGYVKFNMPNRWDIYLHDTPHREDFVKSDRARSSGCVRVEQPKEMAEYILTELNNKRYPISRLDSVIQTQKTRYETLTNKIPVHIVYLTVFDDSDYQHIRFLKDIYKRDAKLTAMLQKG